MRGGVGNRDGQIIWWDDTVANIILGTDPNAHLECAP